MGDIKESAMAKASDGAYIRALDANGNSILISKADLVELIRSNMPVATKDLRGLCESYQGITQITLEPGETKTFHYIKHGLYHVTNYTLGGNSCIVSCGYYPYDFNLLLKTSADISATDGVQSTLYLFKDEAGQTFKVKSNFTSPVQIAINRL